MKSRIIAIAGGVTVIVAAVAIFMLTRGNAATATVDTPVMEVVATDISDVIAQQIEQKVPLSGTLRPYDQAMVKARVPGELAQVRKREGEIVRKGEVLVRMDVTDTEALVAERRALLASAQAHLDLARRNWNKQQQLLAKNYISRNSADSVENSVAVNEANVKVAEAQLERARKTLSDTVLTAPISGVVAKRYAQPGEKLQADAPLFMIVDLSRVEFEAQVPASQIASVQLGSEVSFWVDGLGDDAFVGRVARINPVADERSRKVTVYVVLDNRARKLRGGMFAKGMLTTITTSMATLAPLSSVREDVAGKSVLVLDAGKSPLDGSVREIPVRLGQALPERDLVEIIEGLKPGMRVINASLGNLRAGDRVRIAGGKPAT